MNKTILFFICLFFSATQSFAQFGGTGKVTLPRLGITSKSLTLVMRDINSFLGEKPNGLQYPVTKIVFSQLDDLLCFEIVGVDNSWTDLFKFGEVAYGYVILQNRLFIVVGQGYSDINLEGIFYTIDEQKSFVKPNLPHMALERYPVWFFEYRDNQVYLISVSDLDVLDNY